MLRALAFISFVALVSSAAAQTAPTFDIADVHVSPRTDWVKNNSHALQGGFLIADRYELHRATMLDLIRIAYNVDADKIFGGPSWLDYDRFEVIAKTKPGTRPTVLRQMLQSLLEDRFKLTVKAETREVPGYVLSKGKGELKLKRTDGSGASSCQNQIIPGDDLPSTAIQCRNSTMDAFTAALRQYEGGPLGRLPVVDSTGLEGTWDLDLPVRLLPVAGGSQDARVIEGIEKLGLKLELGKVPQPVLVVESVNEQPSANPPGVEAALPPLPEPEFELASIRLPCNGTMTRTLRFETGGRVTAMCMPLMSLVTDAYHLAPFEQPLGIPKWLSDGTSTAHNISIDAKAPANLAVEPQNNAQARDLLTSMLRALLKDRYKLAVHYEDRAMDAFTLVAAKPKLTKADSSNRTGCTRQTPAAAGGAIAGGAGLQIKLVCQNMTMAQFAEQLQAYDTQIYYPVLDGTGLDGAWDFTLSYDAMAGINARFPLGRPAANPDGQPSEPSGAVSFRDAIEKQLGLKLEMHKRPEPVLVIDHIEEKPTEN